jgi:acetyltransferase-like isoleucine patch superfamily enzyme
MAAPGALIPAKPTLRHRLRARRLRGPIPLIGRDVHIAGEVTLGDGCVIGDGTRIEGKVEIGPGAVLGERCRLIGQAGITLGRNVLVGDGAVFTDFSPVTADAELPTREQGLAAEAIVVGDGARIGHGACLLRGARVKPGGEVAPHAVAGRR